ncbi:MAG: hypothetical protein ABJA37_01465 [Ferruginibacter sp.]
MKRFPLALSAALFFCITMLSSCQAIANIFGAGFKVGIWVSVIVVIIIVVIIIKAFGGKK